ncbi:RNA polymerase II mediator complex subunit [Ascosphaera aggregata]|nr:RNA polymerase II mediator complex subunit [Ascosphaera aggregata]
MQQDSFTLPLRPVTYKKKQNEPSEAEEADQPTSVKTGDDDLALKIAQINLQRGSFRSVTEADLRDEIETAKSKKWNGKGSKAIKYTDGAKNSRSATAASSGDRMEKVYKGRNEMLFYAQQAYMESTFALDFISLILTKYSSSKAVRQAESTVSAILKDKVPKGSIALDYTALPVETHATRMKADDVAIVSRGWKSANFAAASKKLRHAATRINSEVEAENKYWETILQIKGRGWKVMRYPPDRKVLAVQCTSLEAGRSYKDRGWIRLRRSSEGQVILDQGLDTIDHKGLRVRIERKGRIVAKANPKCLEYLRRFAQNETRDELETEEWIKLRRDTLFEEELWHELEREAKNMLIYSIEMNRGLIRFATGRGQEADQEFVILDLAGVNDLDADEAVADDSEMETDQDDGLSEETILAYSAALSLRLLFSYAQRQSYEKRRLELPQPLSWKRRSEPEFQLLRPVMKYIRHKAEYDRLITTLEALSRTMGNAGLECTVQGSRPQSVMSSRSRETGLRASDAATPDTIISPLLEPLSSTISLTYILRTQITITLQTSFDLASSTPRSPHIGVSFHVHSRKDPSLPQRNGDGGSSGSARTSTQRRNSLRSCYTCHSDVMKEVQFLMQCDLVDEASNSSSHLAAQEKDVSNLVPIGDNDLGVDSEYGSDRDNDSDIDFEYEREEAAFLGLHSSTQALNDSRLYFAPLFREAGELSAFSRRKNRSKRLILSLDIYEATLQVESYWSPDNALAHGPSKGSGAEYGRKDDEVMTHVWSHQSEGNGSERTFKEIINHFSMIGE